MLHPLDLLVNDSARVLLDNFSRTNPFRVLSKIVDIGRNSFQVAFSISYVVQSSLFCKRHELQHVGGDFNKLGPNSSRLPSTPRKTTSVIDQKFR
jgi:hypothetical protein